MIDVNKILKLTQTAEQAKLLADMEPNHYALNEETVNAWVEEGRIGNYLLEKREGTDFKVYYAGRVDEPRLRARLIEHVRDNPEGYTHFRYRYAKTVKEAFEVECKHYHAFGGKAKLDNEVHPRRPKGKNYPCPVTGSTELEDEDE